MEKVALNTRRLLLRPPEDGDADAITAACQDRELQSRVPIPVPYGRANALDYIRGYSDSGWKTGRECTWALEFRGDFAGVIGIAITDGGRGEIGYWLTPAARGRGFLNEAGQVVIDFAFATAPGGLGLSRIAWRAFGGNVASARVAQRLGFRFEGIARLGALGRAGLEDDWMAGLLAIDDRAPEPWPDLT